MSIHVKRCLFSIHRPSATCSLTCPGISHPGEVPGARVVCVWGWTCPLPQKIVLQLSVSAALYPDLRLLLHLDPPCTVFGIPTPLSRAPATHPWLTKAPFFLTLGLWVSHCFALCTQKHFFFTSLPFGMSCLPSCTVWPRRAEAVPCVPWRLSVKGGVLCRASSQKGELSAQEFPMLPFLAVLFWPHLSWQLKSFLKTKDVKRGPRCKLVVPLPRWAVNQELS